METGGIQQPENEPTEELPTSSQDKSTGNETITYSRKNTYEATILEKVRITGRESNQEVYHLEISLENSGIKYEPGDSLGVIAQNPDTLIDEILSTLKDDGSKSLDTHAGKSPFVRRCCTTTKLPLSPEI